MELHTDTDTDTHCHYTVTTRLYMTHTVANPEAIHDTLSPYSNPEAIIHCHHTVTTMLRNDTLSACIHINYIWGYTCTHCQKSIIIQ